MRPGSNIGKASLRYLSGYLLIAYNIFVCMLIGTED